ncbi:MAG: hypothetical protein IT537_05955 [Hyphomicrobiales bacterium]|nr:hypothetical protein [Hyphomicrobiales bacterium]
MRALRRLAYWGGAATVALLLAVLASFSDQSGHRPEANAANGDAAKKADGTGRPDPELRRVSEVVHMLAGDREQLSVRVGTIERNLEDLTGSIKRQEAALTGTNQVPPAATAPAPAAPAASPTPPPAAPTSSPVAAAPPAGEPLALTPKATAAVRQPAPAAEASKERAVTTLTPGSEAAAELGHGEIAVDVGGATNFEGLRALWTSTKGTGITLLEGLYPVVAVRENNRTSSPELRLLVGPLPNVETAARLCAGFASARRYCQPVAFEGQRLADTEPIGRKPAGAKPGASQAKATAGKQQQPGPSSRLPRLFQ